MSLVHTSNEFYYFDTLDHTGYAQGNMYMPGSNQGCVCSHMLGKCLNLNVYLSGPKLIIFLVLFLPSVMVPSLLLALLGVGWGAGYSWWYLGDLELQGKWSISAVLSLLSINTKKCYFTLGKLIYNIVNGKV